jgi:hypothetical protein
MGGEINLLNKYYAEEFALLEVINENVKHVHYDWNP